MEQQLTAAEMLAREKFLYAAELAERGLKRPPAPVSIKPMNMQIQWALAVAMGRLPATTVELGRYMYPF